MNIIFWLFFGLFLLKILWNIFVVIWVEFGFFGLKSNKDHVIMNFHYEFLLFFGLMIFASVIDVGYFSNNLLRLFFLCMSLILGCYGVLVIFAKIVVKDKSK